MLLGAERNPAWETLWYSDSCEPGCVRCRIFYLDREQQRKIGDVWERCGRLDCDGRKHRKDLRLEELIDSLAISARKLAHPNDFDVVLLQLWQQHIVEAFTLQLHQFSDARVDGIKLLGLRNTVGASVLDAGDDLASQSCHSHHVELVQVGAEDRQKFYALEQPVPRVERLVQNPGVELEPA